MASHRFEEPKKYWRVRTKTHCLRFRRSGRRPKRPNRVGGHLENQGKHAGRSKTIRKRSRSPGLFHAVNVQTLRQLTKKKNKKNRYSFRSLWYFFLFSWSQIQFGKVGIIAFQRSENSKKIHSVLCFFRMLFIFILTL